jgi:hypothetical protein
LWVGPRVGWFVPFGTLWHRCNPAPTAGCLSYTGVEWSDYAGGGPMFEIDVGARLSRNYNLFALWEHASISGGDSDGLESASTDYFGVGLRVSSDADKIGFLTEINLGARRFRAQFADGTELQLSQDVPFELRIGLGADIRLSKHFSLSPLVALALGRFDTAENVNASGDASDALAEDDELATHGSLSLQMGGHFDLLGGG